MEDLNVERIIEAKNNFTELIRETPLEFNHRLSKKYSCRVYLKREDLQPVRSYKIRGAFNAVRLLNPSRKKRGVVCASAGNHAQGVAISCRHFGVKATIFMPLTTPKQKVRATKKFGGKFVDVILEGDAFDASYSASLEFCRRKKATFVHPFDDLDVIAGQGTTGLEILDQAKEKIDYVLIPVGGGGLMAGAGFYFSKKSPGTKIVGVEPNGAPSMKESLKAGRLEELEKIDAFVDGAAVKKPGQKTFEISRRFVKEIMTIPENRLCSTMVDFLQEEGIILEPAGALSVDALKDFGAKTKNKTVVCITSGGNFDFERMPEIRERSLRYEGLKRYYAVLFPQRAGALKEFLKMLGPKDDIVRFEYARKAGRNRAPVTIGIESDSRKNLELLEGKINKSRFEFTDITESWSFLKD